MTWTLFSLQLVQLLGWNQLLQALWTSALTETSFKGLTTLVSQLCSQVFEEGSCWGAGLQVL